MAYLSLLTGDKYFTDKLEFTYYEEGKQYSLTSTLSVFKAWEIYFKVIQINSKEMKLQEAVVVSSWQKWQE